MGSIKRPSQNLFDAGPDQASTCDVLVIGAGWAGIQAACAAASQGAHVLLLDRLAPEALQATLQDAAAWNPCLSDADRADARLLVCRPGHTALELLLDDSGAVRGAAGVRGDDEKSWQIVAGAVVIASPDALLMAAEAGAELCGMEDGLGGLRICGYGSGGASSVEGLYAAGPAAWSVQAPSLGLPRGTRAHSLLSGQQAGQAAAGEAQALQEFEQPVCETLRQAGCAGLRGRGQRPANPLATLAAMQAVRRSLGASKPDDSTVAEALERLDALWLFICDAAPAARGALCATRAAACQVAMARWQLRSLLTRRASEAAHLARECVVACGVDQVSATTELRDAIAGQGRRRGSPADLLLQRTAESQTSLLAN